MEAVTGNYQYLLQKIDEFIRRYYLNQVIRGAIYLAASLFSAYILVTVAEYYGNFDPVVRTIMFYAFVLLNGYILVRMVVLPLLAFFRLGKTISHEQASLIIGQHFLPVKDKLLNTLQLKKQADANPEQRALIEASINQKIQEFRPIPFTSAVKIRENRRYIKYAAVPLATILLIAVTAPSIFSESTERLLKYNKPFIKKAPFEFVIVNKSLDAVQGDDFELQVRLTGDEIPAEVYLEDGANTFKLEKEKTTRFRHTFKNLQESKTIRLTGGGYTSPDYTLVIRSRPTLLNFDARLEYPAYLGKKNETIDNAGDLTVPEGTKITWKFNTTHTSRIEFGFQGKKAVIKKDAEGIFRYGMSARKNGTYSVKPVNPEVLSSPSSGYQLRVIPDLYPVINVQERQDSVQSSILYFLGQVSDDHGVSGVSFHYRLLGSDGKPAGAFSRAIPVEQKAIQSNFLFTWNVSTIKAAPGQSIEYYFQVRDNDGVNGPKSTRSTAKVYKVPTEREIDQGLEKGSQAVKSKMEQAVRKAAQIEKEAKNLQRDLLDKKNLSYEEKKKIELLLQKQKELDQLVKEVREENKQNMFNREELKDQREEILEKQRQIEELFNNVLDEKTREILKNIEELLQQNNKNQTQTELSKMQMDNKSVQKELDRILELYKQLEFDQKLTESIDKLKEMAKEQQQLSEESKGGKADRDELRNKQQSLNQEFSDLKQDLKDLQQKNEELANKNDFQNPEQEQSQIEQQQAESSKNLEQKNMKKAAENQNKAAQSMQQLSQKLESMQEQNEEMESRINEIQLREILDDLVKSSFDQEKVMQNLRRMSPNDPAYTAQAQKQKEIQDNMKMVGDSLYSLSRKVPQIESVVNKEIQAINFNIGKALESLSERRTAEANRNQQYAMTSINNLALMLSDVSEQLQRMKKNSQSGGKGKTPSLSQLSKMQEQLNKNMQKAREQMQKEGMQPQSGQTGKSRMSEQLSRMAREQQMIRQSLQKLNQELNKDGKSGLGNLDKVAKEMEQSETDLVYKKIRQETLVRQAEILTRLLEAEKAEREREPDDKRESREGRQFPPNYKVIQTEYQKMKLRETELLRTVPPSLNSFYKNKVGDYFKFLNSGK